MLPPRSLYLMILLMCLSVLPVQAEETIEDKSFTEVRTLMNTLSEAFQAEDLDKVLPHLDQSNAAGKRFIALLKAEDESNRQFYEIIQAMSKKYKRPVPPSTDGVMSISKYGIFFSTKQDSFRYQLSKDGKQIALFNNIEKSDKPMFTVHNKDGNWTFDVSNFHYADENTAPLKTKYYKALLKRVPYLKKSLQQSPDERTFRQVMRMQMTLAEFEIREEEARLNEAKVKIVEGSPLSALNQLNKAVATGQEEKIKAILDMTNPENELVVASFISAISYFKAMNTHLEAATKKYGADAEVYAKQFQMSFGQFAHGLLLSNTTVEYNEDKSVATLTTTSTFPHGQSSTLILRQTNAGWKVDYMATHPKNSIQAMKNSTTMMRKLIPQFEEAMNIADSFAEYNQQVAAIIKKAREAE